MVVDGATVVKEFARDTVGFNAFDISALAGSVIDVDDLDWSLPGGVDTKGEFYDGGILVWHCDEGVIAAGLATNTVNADIGKRGLDVEEADLRPFRVGGDLGRSEMPLFDQPKEDLPGVTLPKPIIKPPGR